MFLWKAVGVLLSFLGVTELGVQYTYKQSTPSLVQEIIAKSSFSILKQPLLGSGHVALRPAAASSGEEDKWEREAMRVAMAEVNKCHKGCGKDRRACHLVCPKPWQELENQCRSIEPVMPCHERCGHEPRCHDRCPLPDDNVLRQKLADKARCDQSCKPSDRECFHRCPHPFLELVRKCDILGDVLSCHRGCALGDIACHHACPKMMSLWATGSRRHSVGHHHGHADHHRDHHHHGDGKEDEGPRDRPLHHGHHGEEGPRDWRHHRHGEVGCSPGWERYGAGCFRAFPEAKSWAEAEEACNAEGAHLPSLHSDFEKAFVSNLAHATSWIGASCVSQPPFGDACVSPADFSFTDGSDTSYLKSMPAGASGGMLFLLSGPLVCEKGVPVVILSSQGANLAMKNGKVRLRFADMLKIEDQWKIKDARDARVIFHHGAEAVNLMDDLGFVNASQGELPSEQWDVTDVGNGEVVIRGSRGTYLQEKTWEVVSRWLLEGENPGEIPSLRWRILQVGGSPGCSRMVLAPECPDPIRCFGRSDLIMRAPDSNRHGFVCKLPTLRGSTTSESYFDEEPWKGRLDAHGEEPQHGHLLDAAMEEMQVEMRQVKACHQRCGHCRGCHARCPRPWESFAGQCDGLRPIWTCHKRCGRDSRCHQQCPAPKSSKWGRLLQEASQCHTACEEGDHDCHRRCPRPLARAARSCDLLSAKLACHERCAGEGPDERACHRECPKMMHVLGHHSHGAAADPFHV